MIQQLMLIESRQRNGSFFIECIFFASLFFIPSVCRLRKSKREDTINFISSVQEDVAIVKLNENLQETVIEFCLVDFEAMLQIGTVLQYFFQTAEKLNGVL